MTKNRRFEAHYDALNDVRIAEAAASTGKPVTLPTRAYGPAPIEWAPRGQDVPVWVWIQWSDRPAERISALARGWNDRVVFVEWETMGGRRDTVVWRTAVSRRGHDKSAPSRP